MARRYDGRTTTFSPEGRIFQVEYAIASIQNAAPAVGILTKEGVVIAGEKKVISKLLAPPKSSEKLYKLDEHVGCAVAGLTSDANILIRQARVIAQRHLFRYDEPIPVEMLVQQLCDYKHFYTQTGGLRPFGVSFLYAGWDRHRGYQLYMSDPSGNYGGWKAAAMGSNSQSATSTLKSEYRDDLTLAEAKQLAVRILTKAMDTTAPTADRMDVFTLQHVADTPAETTDSHFADAKDRIFQRRLNDEEVGELIAAVAAETAKAGDK